jgi:hypothetical protein
LNSDLKVIDNAIEESRFEEVQNYVLSQKFPWFYNPVVLPGIEDQYQYTHTVYDMYAPQSKVYDILAPELVKMLNPKCFYRIYINSLPRYHEIVTNPWHVDVTDKKTATFYFNTNNGQTRFKSGECIDSIENRMITFNSKTLHTGTTCTDATRRVVMTVLYDEQ